MNVPPNPNSHTDDGCRLLLVDGFPFQANRALFSRHSAVFRDIFQRLDGQHTVTLHGDAPEVFQDLVIAFHASSPGELQLPHLPRASLLAALIALQTMFAKYECPVYVEWATAQIYQLTSYNAPHHRLVVSPVGGTLHVQLWQTAEQGPKDDQMAL
ncbi:hypothetical protein C8R44DRAFT_764963 [Mycena epipterygia]|nr:hypothetical protein C8R44DRAFT_764963 [Mycena epipterygia]